jgi:hypothetical protein
MQGWFVVDCKGMWLGRHASITEVLCLEFRVFNSIACSVADTWVRALDMFRNDPLVPEIGTIHDRLPVQRALSLPQTSN